MKDPQNIKELRCLDIDFMGMIFYDKSPRFAGNLSEDDISGLIEPPKERVGVFVNAEMNYILDMAKKYNLNLIQLHGNESPEFCNTLRETMPVIKVFSIETEADIEHTKAYEGLCKYFLFDTKTPQHGGSGKKFDWRILDAYTGNTPFLLSGGISPEDGSAIKTIKHPKFCGVDLNSKFETEPGVKNIPLLEKFIKEL